jgi:hypothetical protein
MPRLVLPVNLLTPRVITIYYYYYYCFLLQLGFHPVAAVLHQYRHHNTVTYINGTAKLQYTYWQFTHTIQCAYTNTIYLQKYNISTQLQYTHTNTIYLHTHVREHLHIPSLIYTQHFTSLHLCTHNTSRHFTYLHTLHFTSLHLFAHNPSLHITSLICTQHFTSFHL